MATRTIGPIVARIFGDLSHLDKSLKAGLVSVQRFGNQAKAIGDKVSAAGGKMMTRVTLPIVALGGLATKRLMDFEETMRNVNTVSQETESQFRKTNQQVLIMAESLGKAPTELAEALYFISSSSFKGAEGLKVLEASAKAAKAGVADTASAAVALTAVLNAYGKPASEAADVSDILFKTVELGVLTFSDLAQYMGAAISTAAIAGVRFDEVSAAISVMTRGGIKADEAFTSMNRFLLKIIEGGEDLDAVFKQYAGTTSLAYLQTKGLGETLKALIAITRGDVAMITKLGFEMRSFKAVASLTRLEGREFANDLAIIADKAARAGATDRALAEQNKSLAAQWAKTRAQLNVLLIDLGTQLLPIVRQLMEYVKNLISWWKGLDDGTKKNIIRFALFAAAVGPVLKILGTTISTLGSLTTVMASLGAKMTWLLNPWTALVAITVAATAALIAYLVQIAKLNKDLEKEADIMSRLSDTEKEAKGRFGTSLSRMRVQRQAQMKEDAKLQEAFNRVLAEQIPLETKIRDLQEISNKVWAVTIQERMRGEIARLQEASKAVGAGGAKGPFFLREDLEAQKSYREALIKATHDQLKVEDRINQLVKERKKLQEDLATMKGKEGTKAFMEKQMEALQVETDLADALREKAKDIVEKNKELSEARPFAGAAEKGTVEEYRVRIGMEKRDEVARNTAAAKDSLKVLEKLFKETNTLLSEQMGTRELQLVEIL